MYGLLHSLPNNLRWYYTKLGNFKKIPEMLQINGEHQADHPKIKFSLLSKKVALKCSKGNTLY